MEFFILQDKDIMFSPPTNISNVSESVKRSPSLLEAKITTKSTDYGAESENYCKKLKNALLKNSGCQKRKGGALNWKIGLTVALPNPNYLLSPPTSGIVDPLNERPATSFVEIYDKNKRSNSFVSSLYKKVRPDTGHLLMNIFVSSFGLKNRLDGDICAVSWKAMGIVLEGGIILAFSEHTFEETTLLAWMNGQDFSGQISVSVELNNSALSLLDTMSIGPDSSLARHKKMLNDKICSDLEIIVGTEYRLKRIKCHRFILVAESDVFQRMFENGMREATANVIEMEGNSETGVRAILDYLYYRGTKELHESSGTSLEALQAAEKYNLQSLKETVRDIIMAKEASWFDADMVFSLYMFSRALSAKAEEIKDDDGTDMRSIPSDDDEINDDQYDMWNLLKIRSLKVLKWYYQKKSKTLLESAKYQEIFGGDPKLGMEITSAIMRLQ